MSEAELATLAELAAWLEARAAAHRQAGRLGAASECTRFASAVQAVIKGEQPKE